MNTIDGIIEDLELEESYVGGCTTKGEIIACLENLKVLQKEKESVLKALEDVRAEIIRLSDKADQECKVSNSYSVRERLRTKAQAYDDVAKMIDRKIKEIEHE